MSGASRPPSRLVRAVAVAGVGIAVAATVTSIALRLADPAPVVPSTFGFADVSLVSFDALGVTFTMVGAVLLVRRPTNAVGWLMVLTGLCYPLAALAAAATFSAVAAGPRLAWAAGLAAWLAVLFSTVGGSVFVLGFIFPTGRGHTARWDRWIKIAVVFSPIVLLIGFLLRPGPLQVFPSIDNPFGIGPDLRPLLGPRPSETMAGLAAIIAPVMAWSVVSRWRMSDAIGRRQLKWFIISLLVAVIGIGSATIAAVVTDRPPEAGLALFGVTAALIPVAIGVAILRYHLYDIDSIVSRTIGWALVTGVLVGVFAIGVVGLQAILAGFTQGQTLAVAASTLGAFALFQPLRRRVQRAVDRRFDRAHYDAARTAEAFSDRLRYEVDLPALAADLDATVRASVAPVQLGLWLRRADR